MCQYCVAAQEAGYLHVSIRALTATIVAGTEFQVVVVGFGTLQCAELVACVETG